MGGRCTGLVVIAAFTALAIPGARSGRALAQPAQPPNAGGDGKGAPDPTGTDLQPAAPPPAGSAKEPKDPRLARKWLLAGQQLMQKGSFFAANNRPEEAKAQFENAAAAFQKALAAGDDVTVYVDLASAEERLGKLDEAVKHLRLVAGAKTGVRPDVARKVAARLDDLLTKVGLVTLTVTPAGSSITLGGVELGMSPLPEPLVLMPGTYTLSFQADGFQPKEAELKIEPGSETERAIALEPVKVLVQPVKPAGPDDGADGRRKRAAAWPLYAGVGITGAGVLGTGIFGGLAISRHATFTAASTSSPDRAEARTSGRRFALLADLSLGTAAVAAGVTAYWYIYKYRRSPRKSEERHAALVHPILQTKIDVVPWVQPQSSGVMIAGWF
jgi:PEGA domain-containing protein